MPVQNRRSFIKNTSKAGIAISLMPHLSLFAEPVNQFQQTPLPYAYDAFTHAIDALTMEIHYSKHAAGYTKNLNDAVADEIKASSIALQNIFASIQQYSTKMRNNAGGHFNHEFFWKCLSPNNTGTPSKSLQAAIDQSFGGLEQMKSQFNQAAISRFGSGWAWLIKTNHGIAITSTANQDNPLMSTEKIKGTPLLALDVWEHAYYLKYQNKRAEYVQNWWSIVNWNFVNQQYQNTLI